jgi:hypothetical protein
VAIERTGMSEKDQVIKRIREVLDEAYEEAALLTVAHIEAMDAPRQTFCKEICAGTPYSWQALDSRVRRLQARKASGDADVAPSSTVQRDHAKRAKHALKKADPETIESLISDLPAEKVREVRDAAEAVSRQQHPATAKKVPLGIGESKAGFLLEMGKVSTALSRAVGDYTKLWDAHVEDASDEELQIERDTHAPELLALKMRIEEIEVLS